jgi:hypothetical protein
MLVDAPARQNASAMHTNTSSRSNSGGGGLNGSPCSVISIHDVGKTCRRRSVPYLGDFDPFCPFSVPVTARMPAPAIDCGYKIVMIQRLFKFSLN